MTDELTALILGWIIDYGAPTVGGVLLLAAMGLPLPSMLFVIAAGAFMRQELLGMVATPLWALLGAVAGDTVVYGLGRFARPWIERRFGASEAWRKAQQQFDRRGGIAIYITRWLLTPLAVPTNLVAGSSGYPFGRFLLFDISGEITWLLLYGSLGYAFGDQWSLITEFAASFSGLIVSVLIVVVGIFLLARYSRRPRSGRQTP